MAAAQVAPSTVLVERMDGDFSRRAETHEVGDHKMGERGAGKSVFTVFADGYGPQRELAERRQSFTARSVSHDISHDRRHGVVVLRPQGVILRVGSDADDYQRIRILDSRGTVVGTLRCSADGEVSWVAARTADVPPRAPRKR